MLGVATPNPIAITSRPENDIRAFIAPHVSTPIATRDIPENMNPFLTNELFLPARMHASAAQPAIGAHAAKVKKNRLVCSVMAQGCGPKISLTQQHQHGSGRCGLRMHGPGSRPDLQ